MNSLEIKHLRMVRAIHPTGNLTRAAASLFVTQSALSQQLKEIESRLGADLFHRTGKQMVLTKIGRMLLGRGEKILDWIEKAELDIDRAVNGETGELKVGVRCLFCYMWLPAVLKQFRESYPNVALEIRNSARPDEDLISRRIDIAVSASDHFDPAVDFSFLFQDQVVVVMPKDHVHSRKKALELKDFHGTDIISLVEKSRHYFFYNLLKDRQIKPRRYMTISHPEAMVDLIAAGLGIGILPRWFAAPYVKQKKLVTCPLTASGTTLQWKASWLKGKQVPGFLRAFVRLVSDRAIS